MNLIFIFLDGVGLAPASAHNPLTTAMPRLASVLGGTLTLETAPIIKESLLLTAIDAGLQTEGAGQSGTGQFSIYTSLNGAKLFGRHYGPYLPWALKPALAGANVFRKLQEHGRTACYANAYPKRFIDTCLHLRTVGKTRGSVLFEAAAMENIPLRGAAEVKAGTAISGDIISKWWGTNREDGDAGVSSITPEQAAENLLHLSAMHGAVFYEFFLTDLAAHRRITASVDEVLTRLDGFLSHLALHLPAGTLLALTSDHGNLEDARTTAHTQNPVPLLAFGHGAAELQSVTSISEVMTAVLKIISAQGGTPAAKED